MAEQTTETVNKLPSLLLTGKLLLYTEQGMEGGYLSIQDRNFIALRASTTGIGNNRKVYDKTDKSRIGITSDAQVFIEGQWLPFPDPILEDPDYRVSSIYLGEQNGDREADKRLEQRYKFSIQYAPERLDKKYGVGNWKIDRQLPNVVLNDGTRVHFVDVATTLPTRPYRISAGSTTKVTVTWNDGKVQHEVASENLLVEQFSYDGLHALKETDVLKILDPFTNTVVCEGRIDNIPLKVFSATKQGHFEDCDVDSLAKWERYFTENYTAELFR